jgi:DNA-binding beta-propeller fold protein YncE
VSNFLSGTVVEVNPATPAVLRTFTTGGYPQGIALSADGTELYIANESGWLETRSIATGVRLDSIPLDGGGFGLARSPDDGVLYVGIPSKGEVQIVRRATRQVIKTLATGGVPRRIAFTADGRHAVIANASGWVDVVGR